MKVLRILFSVVIGLIGVLVFTTHAVIASRNVQDEAESSITWSRSLEPVVITGGQVTQFSGVDISHIFAYAYSAGTWEQIPLQIDEVNALGQYGLDNGTLDDNDELVFMAMDLGEMAGQKDWISNGASKNYNRYQLEVTNPLTPTEVGYIYLYQSDTVGRTHPDYVDWLTGTQEIVSEIYSMGIITAPFQREESLELNGHEVDVLDRSKYHLRVKCGSFFGPFSYNLNEDIAENLYYQILDSVSELMTEEQLQAFLDSISEILEFLEVKLYIDGPVRVGGGTLGWDDWAYPTMRENRFGINFDTIKDADILCNFPLTNFRKFEEFQYSFDWVDPFTSTMSTYYDNHNPTGEEINGIFSESLITSPLVSFSQVSGDFGSVLRLSNLSRDAVGNYQNYYEDNSAGLPFDTGDQKSFGDSGYKIILEPFSDEIYGTLDVEMIEYFLGPNSPNVGETYLSYKENPFLVAAASQDFYTELYLPLILIGSAE